MKMHQQKQPRKHWLDCADYQVVDNSDEEDELYHPFVPEYNSESHLGDTECDFNGPPSTMSCPPSVGADMDAFLLTPQNIYAPFTPGCPTNQSQHESEVKGKSKDVILSCHSENVPDSPEVSCRLSEQDIEADVEFDSRSTSCDLNIFLSDLYTQSCIMGNELPDIDLPGVRRSESCLSDLNFETDKQHLVGVDNQQSVGMVSIEADNYSSLNLAGRRMSFDELVDSLNEEEVLKLFLNCCRDQIQRLGSSEKKMAEGSNQLSNRVNEMKNTSTERADALVDRHRKRGAEEEVFPDQDLHKTSSPSSSKRRLIIDGQNRTTFNGNERSGTNLCSILGRRNEDEPGRVPDVDIVNVMDTVCPSAIGGVRARHRSLPETCTTGQKRSEHSLDTYPPAISTTGSSVFDQNGNILQTNSREVDNYTSLYFVEGEQNTENQQAIITWRDRHIPQDTVDLTHHVSRLQETVTSANIPQLFQVEVNRLPFTADTNSTAASQLNDIRSDNWLTLIHRSRNGLAYLNQHHEVKDDGGLAQLETQTVVSTPAEFYNCQDSDTLQLNQFNSEPASATHEPVPFTIARPLSRESLSIDQTRIQQELDTYSSSFCAEPFPNTFNHLVFVTKEDSTTASTLLPDISETSSLFEYQVAGKTDIVNSETTFNDKNFGITSRDISQTLSHDTSGCTTRSCDPSYSDSHLVLDNRGGAHIEQATSLSGSSTSQTVDQRARSFLSNNNNSHIINTGQDVHTGRHWGTEVPLPATSKAHLSLPSVYLYSHSHLCDLDDDTPEALSCTAESDGNVLSIPDAREDIDNIYYSVDSAPVSLPVDASESDESMASSALCGQEETVDINCDTDSLTFDDQSVTGTTLLTGLKELARNAHPGLVDVHNKFCHTGNISAIVKHELKNAILSKRHKEGKKAIDVKFEPAAPNEMTDEEKAKETRRKELNKKAAANHRQRKKEKYQLLDDEYNELAQKKTALMETIADMQSERVALLNVLISHGILIPEDVKTLSLLSPLGGGSSQVSASGTSGCHRLGSRR